MSPHEIHILRNCWRSMRERCRNPKAKQFSDYGGRGVTVCERWNSFEKFASDVGPRPPGKTLDRINVNGNYEPSNCRWATHIEQQRNRRNNRRHRFFGEMLLLPEISERTGINIRTLGVWITRGLSLEEKSKTYIPTSLRIEARKRRGTGYRRAA